MHPPKLFVTDLDGTVLIDQGSRGCHATERAKAALRGLQESGVAVCLASGRMHESMRDIAREMGLHCPLISYNGGMLRDAEDRVLLNRCLDADLAADIVALAESRDLPLNYYLDGVLYARRIQPWWDLYQGRTSSPMRAVESQRSLAGASPNKLLIVSDAATIRALRDELEPRYSGRCRLMITADEYLEFIPLGVDKGEALAVLAARLGLGPEQVAAAGDGWNDVGMLRWAGTAIAVEGGRAELKAEADHLVPGPAQDGLARFIEDHYLLAGRLDG
jgi:Cof subfamily protein (haloacid dehalogenase superfamily)